MKKKNSDMKKPNLCSNQNHMQELTTNPNKFEKSP